MYSCAVPGVDEQRGRDKRADVQHVGGELEPRTRTALSRDGALRHSRQYSVRALTLSMTTLFVCQI